MRNPILPVVGHMAVVALCVSGHVFQTHAKIVRSSGHATYDAGLAQCSAGDVYLIDKNLGGSISDPPSGIQIVGGSATWNLTRDVSDVVLFNHTPTIKQTAGRLRRVTSNGTLGGGSRLTHVDSCFFIPGAMGSRWLHYEIDGFLRHSTFAFNGSYMGSSTINLMGSGNWTAHSSNFIINATDPVGDGSGTLICNIVSHGQIDWTPVHIINGRGITVAHIMSEYCEFADPFLSIENGVECASVHHNPGGHISGLDWERYQLLNDGTRAYPWMSARWGAFRIGGMNNTALGGVNYVPFRGGLTGSAWEPLIARDPYLTKWNPNNGTGINFAKPLRVMAFGSGDNSMMKQGDHGSDSYVIGSEAPCTTAFINSQNGFVSGRLRGKPLRAGLTLYRPYVPDMPRIKLDGEGPGTNMSASTGEQIRAAVNANQTVYLGAGTYQIPGTLSGGTIYGAGKDQTILKFPSGQVCTKDKIGLYNLTVEGGTIGYLQATFPPSCHSLKHTAIRFKGQSTCGAQLSCVQNCSGFYYIEFDGCQSGIITVGSCQTIGMNDNKAIDKFNLYGCTFRNLGRGLRLAGGTDGFVSLIGCSFENISGTGAELATKGNYVAGCTFVNCGTAINATYVSTIHNCTITGPASSTGITGSFGEIVSCAIKGCGTAINIGADKAVVSDCESDGSINARSTTWIGLSKFRNVNVPLGARYGSTDLSQWAFSEGIPIDQTPPGAPGNLSVRASGAHNVLTWSRSSDPESGIMQYIIERDGAEIGRTNFNYHANYHVIADRWGAQGWPGAGVYKDPRPVYVDQNAAASFSSANYRVVAVNFAQIRSDNTMARLRLWTHLINPYALTGSGTTRLSDSVFVGLGSFTTTTAGAKTFTAVRYRGRSGSGIKRGITDLATSAQQPRVSPVARAPRPGSGRIEIFSLFGARIASVDAPEPGAAKAMAVARSIVSSRAPGTYLVHYGGRTMSVVWARPGPAGVH